MTEGEVVPATTLPLAGGGTLAIGPGRGRPLVLFFYPKADTPGCTSEAREFSALMSGFADAGVDVAGVSRDPLSRLERFADRQALIVPLASDAGALSDALGLWVEKAMYGRRYMGMERATLLLDGGGRIVRMWRKVKVAGHARAVLESLADDPPA